MVMLIVGGSLSAGSHDPHLGTSMPPGGRPPHLAKNPRASRRRSRPKGVNQRRCGTQGNSGFSTQCSADQRRNPLLTHNLAEILIVDEAERLSNTGLDHLRDLFDRTGIGVVLVGMPVIEKRVSRYPQLYNRIGFAHHYRPLQGDELAFVLTRHWRRLGLALDDADFTDAQAIASISRITGGNFRLLHRLFVQIGRILKINGLSVITDDVVEAARSTLVIGTT